MMLLSVLSLIAARTYAIEPIEVRARFALSTMKREESNALVSEQVMAVLKTSLEKENRILVLPGETAQRTLKVAISEIKQANRSRQEILNDPNGGASRTEVTVRLTINSEPEVARKGFAKGSYIGTTDRYELGGSPDMKASAIRFQNLERAKAIGRAVWDAIKTDALHESDQFNRF